MSFQGKLQAIYIGTKSGQPMASAMSAEAISGQGIATDRYAVGTGTFAKPNAPENEITLIESEAVAAAEQEYNMSLAAAETRRNLVTKDVPLNHLVGKEFRVGSVLLRGLELCEPCKHLEKHLGKPVVKALRHRGGLRAQVIEGGILNVGDGIKVPNAS